VLLGKIYYEKGMLDEAKKEFEGVIRIVPDNLFAHKKLAEIYRDTGEADLAIKECKSILKLNPMDEETLNSLREIEAASAPVQQAAEPEPAKSPVEELRMPGAAVEEESHDVHSYGAIDVQDIKVEHSEEELNSFKASLFGDNLPSSEDEGAAVEEISAVEEQQVEEPAEVQAEEAFDISEADETSFASIGSDMTAEEVAEVQAAEEPAESVSEDLLELADESFDISEDAGIADAVPPVPLRTGPDMSEADSYVAEGRFSDAMNIYRRMLSADASNKIVLQRVEELRALLKLMGKDKEVLVAKLNSFLEGINKRRDEFLRHS
jgi:tetratricopeptide (TPR) repeat protein